MAVLLGIHRTTAYRWTLPHLHAVLQRRLDGPEEHQWSSTNRPTPCEDCAERDSLPHEAYVYLLGLYLGDGSIAIHRRGVQKLTVTCCDWYPLLLQECVDAMQAVAGPRTVSIAAKSGCHDVYAYWKHWVCLFPQDGPGKKHDRLIELAPWQHELVDRHSEQLIRGLIHSDGCRAINKVKGRGGKRYEYVRYFFTNRSDDIRRIFCDTLDRLDIAWRQDGPYNISIARKESVAKLESIVGPKR